jgi:HD-like signal output (HDOD) protein
LTTDRLEELIKQDATLSLRVPQCINSAAFPIRREVRSGALSWAHELTSVGFGA